MENEYSSEELERAVSEFIYSCHGTGHHDMDDNFNYFMRENDHMDLDEDEVYEIFESFE